MAKKKEKKQIEAQKIIEEQKEQEVQPLKKEKRYPVIYSQKSWKGNKCTITFTVATHDGHPVKEGVLQIFCQNLDRKKKINQNGVARFNVIVEKKIVIGVVLLGSPASTWVNLFKPIEEKEVVSALSARRFLL